MGNNLHPETSVVHEGVGQDSAYHSVSTPIYQTISFEFDSPDSLPEHHYTRVSNPTRNALEDNLNALEGGAGAFATGGGTTAIFLAMSLLKAGDHVIAANDLYCGTYRLLTEYFSKFNIEASFVSLYDSGEVRRAVKPNTKLIWMETPSNPLLRIVDIPSIVKIAQEHGLLTGIDNTFMTPLWQSPMQMGVDLVVYSSSKYISGHGDVLSGIVIARTQELANEIARWRNLLGISSCPMESWMVLRGLKTLPHRLKAHERNAQALVDFLSHLDFVKQIYYPGLKTHPGHDIAAKQQKSFGGMLSFEVDEDQIDIKQFFSMLRLFKLSMSLGSVTSLISQPWAMSFSVLSLEKRQAMGIQSNLIRISTGIEHPDDLIADLSQALNKSHRAKAHSENFPLSSVSVNA